MFTLNVSKFDRVTNRITKRAKRERGPSKFQVKIFMKFQKKIKNRKNLKAFVKSHFTIITQFLPDSYASLNILELVSRQRIAFHKLVHLTEDGEYLSQAPSFFSCSPSLDT